MGCTQVCFCSCKMYLYYHYRHGLYVTWYILCYTAIYKCSIHVIIIINIYICFPASIQICPWDNVCAWCLHNRREQNCQPNTAAQERGKRVQEDLRRLSRCSWLKSEQYGYGSVVVLCPCESMLQAIFSLETSQRAKRQLPRQAYNTG